MNWEQKDLDFFNGLTNQDNQLDYLDGLKVHTTANQCKLEINEWLKPIKEHHKGHGEDYMGYV